MKEYFPSRLDNVRIQKKFVNKVTVNIEFLSALSDELFGKYGKKMTLAVLLI